jgi:DNA-binding MurR/RpiR family transcriptional regulator
MASPTFDERIAAHFQRMRSAERRVARFFQENREQVLIASAASLASKAETSDATILRATKALGFGLEDLRRALADELRNFALAGRAANTNARRGRVQSVRSL